MTNPELSNGVHPETGLYHIDQMPPAEDPTLRAIREKQLRGESLSLSESMKAGRDETVDALEDYELKPDHVYRAVGRKALEAYMQTGLIHGRGGLEVTDDEYEEGNNKGVDWYLGGAALKYGAVLLEAPADPRYFVPAAQSGHALAKDPRVRHMKSSGATNPVPMDMARIIKQ
ncbi:MAG: hypothetical protein WAW80_02360 [Candidatus Saccharimonadales bacterium]